MIQQIGSNSNNEIIGKPEIQQETKVSYPASDDFSTKVDRDYADYPEESAENARYLEEIMLRRRFEAYQGEWRHYTDTDTYGVEKDFNLNRRYMVYGDYLY